MTKKRYLLKYIPYECSNGEVIEEGEPYFIDTKEKVFDIDDYYTIDGYPVMSDKQVLDLLNENEQLKQIVKAFKEKLCELGISDVKYQGVRYDTGLEEWLDE